MSGNKYSLLLRCSCGLRCHTFNNQCSHPVCIDNWCPALLAPFTAIKRSRVSHLVCVWVPMLPWCVSCCGWAEELIKIRHSPVHRGHSQIFGSRNAEDDTPFPLSLAVIKPIAPCFLLFLFQLYSRLGSERRGKKCLWRTSKWELNRQNLFW